MYLYKLHMYTTVPNIVYYIIEQKFLKSEIKGNVSSNIIFPHCMGKHSRLLIMSK